MLRLLTGAVCALALYAPAAGAAGPIDGRWVIADSQGEKASMTVTEQADGTVRGTLDRDASVYNREGENCRGKAGAVTFEGRLIAADDGYGNRTYEGAAPYFTGHGCTAPDALLEHGASEADVLMVCKRMTPTYTTCARWERPESPEPEQQPVDATKVIKLPSSATCVKRKGFKVTVNPPPSGEIYNKLTIEVNDKVVKTAGTVELSDGETLTLPKLPRKKARIDVKLMSFTAPGGEIRRTKTYKVCG